MRRRLLSLVLPVFLLSLAACEAPLPAPPAPPALNRAPVATDDRLTVPEDETLTLATADLLANDSDPDGDTLTVVAIQGATLTGTTISFTPEPDFHGDVILTYEITDGEATASANVTITVTPVNDPPVAADDAFTMNEDATFTIDAAALLANDSDVDGDPLTVVSVGIGELHGSTFTYTPPVNFHGTVPFTYHVTDGAITATANVTLTVLPVNDAPVVKNDLFMIDEDTVLSVEAASLLANDSDVDGDPLTITSVEGASLEGSMVVFTPDANFNGNTSFTYVATDGIDSATGAVNVTVLPVNDPVIAIDDTATMDEDTIVFLDTTTLVANDLDVDGDRLTIVAVSDGAVLEGAAVTFAPDPDFHGETSFTYEVTDGFFFATGTVNVTVLPVNDPPRAVDDALSMDQNTVLRLDASDLLANDVDVDRDLLTVLSVEGASLEGRTITYTPPVNFHGIGHFSYTASDGEYTSGAHVTVNVRQVNHVPVANDDYVYAEAGDSVTIDVVANDTDADGDQLTVSGIASPSLGVVTLNGDGTLQYTAETDTLGEVAFNITITDGVTTVTSTVFVTVGSTLLTSLEARAGGSSLRHHLSPAFSGDVTSYTLEVGLSVQTIELLAHTRDPEATLLVDGSPASSGVPTTSLALPLGLKTFNVAVSRPGAVVRIYDVHVTRSSSVVPTAYLKASNTDSNDYFGDSVAIDGDTLAVGAYREASAAKGINGDQEDNSAPDAGAVYVFVRDAGEWRQEAYLKASNAAAGDLFGRAVALSGDRLVVGAPAEDSSATGVGGDQESNESSNSGAVYVFARSAGGWVQEAYIKASNTRASAYFGSTIAIDGDTIAVGTPSENSASRGVNGSQAPGVALSGAVYVFEYAAGTWSQTAFLKASNADAFDQFGRRIALDSDTLVVGVPNEASSSSGVNGYQFNNVAPYSGAAYVFARADGGWTQKAYLKASNAEASDQFGYSVDVEGGTIAVGAIGESSGATGVGGNEQDNTIDVSGAVYIFTRKNDVWSQQAYVKAPNTDAHDQFGADVALDGDTLAVGAYGEDSRAVGIDGEMSNNFRSNSGAVFVLSRTSSTWSHRSYIKTSNSDRDDLVGGVMGLSGYTLVVGVRFEDSAATGVDGDQSSNAASDSGAAYVFEL